MSATRYVTALRRMCDLGLSFEDAIEVLELLSEPDAPSSAALRQRRYRQKKAESVTDDVTRDVTRDVTPETLPLEQKVSPTPPSKTQTLSPKERPLKGSKERGLPAGFEAAWKAYPHQKTRSSRPRSIQQFERLRDVAGLQGAVEAYRAACRADADMAQFAPGFQKWLGDELWRDWLPTVEPEESDPGFETWQTRMSVWRESRKWGAAWGPCPGEPGCRVPVGLLLEVAA